MKKTIALVLAVVLLMVATVGGTLAWLTASTTPVVNTFTTSDINVELKETTGNSYQMIPGYTITKNPEATVKANSVSCFLFVKLTKSTSYDTFLENYTIADGWTALTDVDGVYYREVEGTNGIITTDTTFDVLKGDSLTVKGSVTKADMNGLAERTYPTLTIQVYASQMYKNNTQKFTAAQAWANVSNPSGTTSAG